MCKDWQALAISIIPSYAAGTRIDRIIIAAAAGTRLFWFGLEECFKLNTC